MAGPRGRIFDLSCQGRCHRAAGSRRGYWMNRGTVAYVVQSSSFSLPSLRNVRSFVSRMESTARHRWRSSGRCSPIGFPRRSRLALVTGSDFWSISVALLGRLVIANPSRNARAVGYLADSLSWMLLPGYANIVTASRTSR